MLSKYSVPVFVVMQYMHPPSGLRAHHTEHIPCTLVHFSNRTCTVKGKDGTPRILRFEELGPVRHDVRILR